MKYVPFLLCLLLWPIGILAQTQLASGGLDAFGRLPILHEGRLKPLDSFARLHYQAVTGQAAPADNTALAWLAEAMFNPARAAAQPFFAVRDTDALHRLGLPVRSDKIYPFQELVRAMLAQQAMLARVMEADGKTLTADERALRALYRSVNDFRQITGGFSLLLPITMALEPEARARLGLAPDAPVTLRSLLKLKPEVMEKLQATMAAKKSDVSQYSEEEQRNAHLAYQISLLEAVGDQNSLLRVIPPHWDHDETWRAPWDIVNHSLGGAATQQFFLAWENLARAWQADDGAAWDSGVQRIAALNAKAQPALRHGALRWEIWLNRLQPFHKSLGLVLTGLALLGLARWRAPRFLGILARGVLWAALLAHGLGLGLRMAILQRPPVTNIYESTIFVGFMALACGLLLAWRRRGDDGLFIGGGIAALLLLSSMVFGTEGDTLQVLVAVLDTNFWLATHVVCITTGYAAALVGGMMAHLYLLRRVAHPQESFPLQPARIHKTAIFALLFTAIGTMLGGVWADQSWGRFWGWDPKENGALWIVLWLIWLLHGRLAGQLGPLGFAVGMALVNIVVALAWFGVNLLSVGLHSYGFTDTAAYGLLAFCLAELVLIGALTVGYFWRRRRLHAA